MHIGYVNIALGFLEGLALIASPCILPILPIILAGSLTGSKRRPVGIIIGFIIVFALFTYFSRKLVQFSGIDLNLIRTISFSILFLLALIMLSSTLTEKFTQLTQKLTQVGSKSSTLNNPEGGFTSGVLFGGLIALIWTPCAGPILAAVIVQTVIQQSNLTSFLILLAFALGAAIPMLLIVLFGRKIMAHFGFLTKHTHVIRKVLGIIIILSIGYMMYFTGGLPSVNANEPTNSTPNQLQNALSAPYPAPAIEGIDAWINSPSQNINALRGKVILIDFWTYSCINCMRTLPYLKQWYHQYHDKGLVIIGVHTPEFDFEKNQENVKQAVLKFGITYPVALDSHFTTWQNYNNQYWPAHYLIDQKGNVVYTHFGEGDYDVTENNIRYLLNIHDSTSTYNSNDAHDVIDETPETYLGYDRADHYASPQRVAKDKATKYSFPEQLKLHYWGLNGSWKVMPDRIISNQTNAAIKLHFHASKVNIVMRNTTKHPIRVKLLLNGENVLAEKGKDVRNSSVEVNKAALYQVLVLPQTTDGILQVISTTPGLEVYTFTFG